MRDPLAELSFETAGNVVVGRVVGEIESVNAQEMSNALAAQLTSDRAGLVIDLSRVTYLDSAGIELLFDLARRLRTHRQRLRLVVPVDAPMRRVLELCDIDRAAPIDATVEGALEGLGESSAVAGLRRAGGRPGGAEALQRLLQPAWRIAARGRQDLANPVRERLEQQQLPSPGEPARPRRQADHAHELSRRDHRCVDRRPTARVAGGARAANQLRPALQRRPAQRSLSERDPLGMMVVAVLVGVALDRGAAQREPVLLGEEDRAPVDVVERDQPREQGRQGRVGLPGRQVGPGARPAGRASSPLRPIRALRGEAEASAATSA